ncbi:TIR domain-containing protein [Salipiger mangrovisoli]|uniref:TIR domain-containing protein n=1 Tax=Salipiger mangrovisoli TaxID=2865933 RepID=A0ABR9X2P3_9RHOB|nr:TIR domain-containing protein [Salipiger mangrovisoli]
MFSPTPSKRRVFFSFHYQNDIWRVNQVRNSWRYAKPDTREGFGFYDASIWESAKRTSDDSLKNLIRNGISNTSVTCVLAGEQTYARRWVRYEIARSVLKGNGLLTVNISSLRDRLGYQATQGPNPLDYMGLYRDNLGQIRLAELKTNKWHRYQDYQQVVTPPETWFVPAGNVVHKLSNYALHYCYVAHRGSDNFGSWVRNAASIVGR